MSYCSRQTSVRYAASEIELLLDVTANVLTPKLSFQLTARLNITNSYNLQMNTMT